MDEATMTVNTPTRTEIFMAFQQVVDALDFQHMVIDGTLTAPDAERTQEEYLARATKYLRFLLNQIRHDDLVHVATMPLDEGTMRGRISRVLQSSTRR